MDLFTRQDLTRLLVERPGPCLSIYLPTHPGGAEMDRILWKNQLTEAVERLAAGGFRTPEVRDFLEPAQTLLDEPLFWKHQSDGLAFFRAPQFVVLFRLPLVFATRVEVGARFQIKPLLPLLSANGRFYILALSQKGVRFLQGTQYNVSALDLKGLPRNLAEALATHDTDAMLTFHSRPAGGLGSWAAIFSGHGVGVDDKKDDLLRYFRQIDRALHPVLREERAPLVLAGVGYLLPIYGSANTYLHLLSHGVEGNPDRMSDRELHDRALALVEPSFRQAERDAVARYHQLAGTGNTASAVEEVVPAAYGGRIEILLVARGEEVWGRFDPATGQVERHERPTEGDEELTNLAAIYTLLHGGTVYLLPPEQMPDTGSAAAVLRRAAPTPGSGKAGSAETAAVEPLDTAEVQHGGFAGWSGSAPAT
jgi:hypothetical protein